jgi:hypothetical protein
MLSAHLSGMVLAVNNSHFAHTTTTATTACGNSLAAQARHSTKNAFPIGAGEAVSRIHDQDFMAHEQAPRPRDWPIRQLSADLPEHLQSTNPRGQYVGIDPARLRVVPPDA